MVDFQKEGIKIIDDLVQNWTCKYCHLTTFSEKIENTYKLLTINYSFIFCIFKIVKDSYVNSVYHLQINQFLQPQ